jgi:hypothetical protein
LRLREKIFWLAIGAIFIIGFSFLIPAYGQICEQNPETKHEECASYHATLVALWHISKFFDDHNGAFTALFTIVLSISTIGLWTATNRLWRSGERQLELIEANAIDQSRDTKESIAAVLAANEISQQRLIADQRAWLSVKVTIQSHFRINSVRGLEDEDGWGSIEIGFEIQNIGKTPAFNVHADAEIIFDHPFTAPRVLKAICARNRGVTSDLASLVLPGDGCGNQLELEFEQSELEHFGGEYGLVLPTIVGCVTYQILPDKSFHQTGFIYYLTGGEGHPLHLPIYGSTLQGALLLSSAPGWIAD